MAEHSWTPTQLRRMPELRRFDPADPFARKWVSRWGWGWWLRVGCSTGLGAAVLVIFGLVAPALLSAFSQPLSARSAGSVVAPIFITLSLIAAGLAAWAGYAMERSIHRTLLRAELRSRGFPVCVRCGYDAADDTSERCPECGAAHA